MTRVPQALILLAALVFAATGVLVAQTRATLPGDALPGLTAAEFEEFRLGRDDFLEVETAEEGLGPAFNGTSCAACHSVPAVGGMSAIAEVRAGRLTADGRYEGLDAAGETLVHLFSLPGHACQPVIPADANIIVRRIPIPVFGAGLVEAIADDTILALADPDDRNGDGVSGRAAIVTDRGTGDRRVGRFGWKAQHATLLAFSGDAYRNEMGITNDLFRDELAVGIDAARMRVCDPLPDTEDIPDPLTRRRGIDNFASFMRFLAPAERAAGDDVTREGERVFMAIGCAACHVPTLTTAESRSRCSIAVPSRCSPICCCTRSRPATASGRRRPSTTRSGRRRCGACGTAVRCCTTARRRRSPMRSCATAGKPPAPAPATIGSATRSAPRCSDS